MGVSLLSHYRKNKNPSFPSRLSKHQEITILTPGADLVDFDTKVKVWVRIEPSNVWIVGSKQLG